MIFDNREIAIIFWLCALLFWALTKKQIRQSLAHVAKALFAKSIMTSFVVMVAYILLEIAVLYHFKLWNISQLKMTIFWGLIVATSMLFNFNKIIEDPNFLSKAIKDNIRFTVFIDFIVNLYVFSLLIELIFVPVSALIGGMIAVAESDEKYKPVEKLLNVILGIFGLWLIIYAFYHIFIGFSNFSRIQTIKDLILPPILSLMLLPFIYLVALFAQYEILFIRLRFSIKDPHLVSFTKYQLLINYNFNFKSLEQWSKGLPYQSFRTKQDIINSFKESNDNSSS